jgi:DUF971 family protein
MTKRTDPLHIAVSKSRGVTIDWADGHQSEYGCAMLRDACPCATCTGAHGTEPQPSDYAKPAGGGELFPMFKPKVKMHAIEEVGSYAFRIDWSDGHNAGIYSYDYLRQICPCGECEAKRKEDTK